MLLDRVEMLLHRVLLGNSLLRRHGLGHNLGHGLRHELGTDTLLGMDILLLRWRDIIVLLRILWSSLWRWWWIKGCWG